MATTAPSGRLPTLSATLQGRNSAAAIIAGLHRGRHKGIRAEQWKSSPSILQHTNIDPWCSSAAVEKTQGFSSPAALLGHLRLEQQDKR